MLENTLPKPLDGNMWVAAHGNKSERDYHSGYHNLQVCQLKDLGLNEGEYYNVVLPINEHCVVVFEEGKYWKQTDAPSALKKQQADEVLRQKRIERNQKTIAELTALAKARGFELVKLHNDTICQFDRNFENDIVISIYVRLPGSGKSGAEIRLYKSGKRIAVNSNEYRSPLDAFLYIVRDIRYLINHNVEKL